MLLDVSPPMPFGAMDADLPKNGLESSSPYFNGPRSDNPHLVTIFVAIPVATSISLDAPVVMPSFPLIISSAILPPKSAAILL